MLYTLTGTSDEAWFYQVSVAIEARGGSIIPVIVKAINAAREDDPQTIISCLCQLADCIEELGIILERMYEGCSPEIFYHRIRPFLAGSKNMASAGLPNGVFYEEDDGKGQWHQYSGGSNAQSSLIQLFDIVLGVSHSPMIGSKTGAVAPKQKHNFLEVRNHTFTSNFYYSTDYKYRRCEDICQKATGSSFKKWTRFPIFESLSKAARQQETLLQPTTWL